MNVTVVVPKALQLACDGRSHIELGVPSNSSLGDVVHTLLLLYPKLLKHLEQDKGKNPSAQVFSLIPWGRTLLLVSSSNRALNEPAKWS